MVAQTIVEIHFVFPSNMHKSLQRLTVTCSIGSNDGCEPLERSNYLESLIRFEVL